MIPAAREYFPTPDPFTRWLFDDLPVAAGLDVGGIVFEPCVGDGAIIRAAPAGLTWKTNDLDPRWSADWHLDAAASDVWDAAGEIDWTVTNPPFTIAIDMLIQALRCSRIGVAMHLRASIHEVLKTGIRRTFMATHPPTGILWLPRFAYQRSRTTGKWTTDSVGACWVVWLKTAAPPFIRYAPERVIDELDVFTPAYRRRMDILVGGAT